MKNSTWVTAPGAPPMVRSVAVAERVMGVLERKVVPAVGEVRVRLGGGLLSTSVPPVTMRE